MKQIVIRDKDNNVINIGEWDYMEELQVDPETMEEVLVVNNPLPEGSTSAEEEIITLDDGGLGVK